MKQNDTRQGEEARKQSGQEKRTGINNSIIIIPSFVVKRYDWISHTQPTRLFLNLQINLKFSGVHT